MVTIPTGRIAERLLGAGPADRCAGRRRPTPVMVATIARRTDAVRAGPRTRRRGREVDVRDNRRLDKGPHPEDVACEQPCRGARARRTAPAGVVRPTPPGGSARGQVPRSPSSRTTRVEVDRRDVGGQVVAARSRVGRHGARLIGLLDIHARIANEEGDRRRPGAHVNSFGRMAAYVVRRPARRPRNRRRLRAVGRMEWRSS